MMGSKMAVDLSMPILVVDDYNTMVRIIRNLLRQLGFQDVDAAVEHDGEEMREARHVDLAGDAAQHG